MNILKYKKIFLGLSSALVLGSLIVLVLFKLQIGIEFTGGSILDFSSTEEGITQAIIQERLGNDSDQSFVLRTTENGFSLRMKDIGGDNKHNIHILNVLSNNNRDTLQVQKFDTIGPTLGSELQSKALVALLFVILSITVFIAYAFRYVSKPVSSWKYGLITMIALVHDIAITVGAFALLGHFMGTEVDSLFITALLVILGYSINDTIVVFDRVRENLMDTPEDKRMKEFDSIIGKSLSQTFVRSINTSFTTLMSIGVIWYFTTGSVQNFALALLIGIASGTYSSIFVAAPLLTYFKPKEEKA